MELWKDLGLKLLKILGIIVACYIGLAIVLFAMLAFVKVTGIEFKDSPPEYHSRHDRNQSEENGNIRVLKSMGYTDIKMTGIRMFKCPKEYTFSIGFEATSQSGTRVTGTVCSGFTMGHTVLLD